MTDFPGRLRAPRYAAPPPSVIGGEVYFDTTANELRYWNGTAWEAAGPIELVPSTFVPAARVYKATPFSCATSSFLAVDPFDAERWDTDNMHSLVTNPARLTIRTAGKYLFHGQAYYPASASGNHRLVQIRLNGSLPIGSSGIVATFGGGAVRTEAAATWECVPGDFVEMLVYQDTGATQIVSHELGGGPEFEACYLGSNVSVGQPAAALPPGRTWRSPGVATQAINTSVPTVIPEMALTMTALVGRPLLVTFRIGYTHTAVAYLDIYPHLDGSPYTSGMGSDGVFGNQTLANNAYAQSAIGSWIIPDLTGTHTLDLRGITSSAGGNYFAGRRHLHIQEL